jgi:hypothetical protein
MDERNRRVRIAILVTTHVVIGAVTAGITAYFQSHHWPAIAQAGYVGFFASEIVLLGMWVGFGSHWWARFCGLLAGTSWLCLIFLAAMESEEFLQTLPEIILLVSLCTIGVSGSTVLLRKTTAHVELRAEWPRQPMAKDLQFNMKTLLWLTALIGTILGMGGIVRRWGGEGAGSWGGEGAGIVVLGCVFALEAMLVAWLLVFAGLGRGHNRIRIPMILAGVAILGLLPPYYLGGPAWRFRPG